MCCAVLPPGKPRYVMGIGYPLDIVVCTALGADMYDRWAYELQWAVWVVEWGHCVSACMQR